MNDVKQFLLGERRNVTLNVWLSSGESFTISSPKWALICGNIEESGECSIEESEKGCDLTATVEPKRRGRYVLQYTFEIANEVVKKNVDIEVK